jgi:phosphomannomutase
VVLAGRADLGLVLDADGERLSLVEETGRPLSEEMTLPLAALAALARGSGAVVTNVCTTALVDRVAARHGAKVVRTPVGQAYVSEAIREHGAVVGGEGNGGVAVPRVHATHDSAAAAALLLVHLAGTNGPLSALVATLPRLVMRKLAVPVPPRLLYSAFAAFRGAVGEVPGATVDHTDGVKVVWPDGWVHVRPSNTQSLVRILAEAESEELVGERIEWAREKLRA